MNSKKYHRGMQIRRSVLGDAHVDRAESGKTELDEGFQQFITEFAWGTVWAGNDALDIRSRHLITIALLAASGQEQELVMHLRATRNTGLSLQEIREVFHHVAVYAGIPAANTAFRIAKEVLVD